MQMRFTSSINTSFISALHAENDAQFLNASSVSLSASTVISEKSQRLDLILSVSNLI